MKYRNAKAFALVLLLSSCNVDKGLEESVLIYDPKKSEIFINLLEESKVDYRITNEGQIFYPVSQKNIVKEAFEKVTGKKIPDFH